METFDDKIKQSLKLMAEAIKLLDAAAMEAIGENTSVATLDQDTSGELDTIRKQLKHEFEKLSK